MKIKLKILFITFFLMILFAQLIKPHHSETITHIPLYWKNNYPLSIGMDESEIVDILGFPTERVISEYNYTWWIYANDYCNYIQVGIADGKVVSLYSNGLSWSYQGIKKGDSRTKIFENYENISFQYVEFQDERYIFQQSSHYRQRKLFFDGEIAVEYFIDEHDDNRVTAIRLTPVEKLMTYKNYPFKYYHTLEPIQSSRPPCHEMQFTEIDYGNERMLFHLTNSVRHLNHLHELQWDPSIGEIAYNHSLDMCLNDFFSHCSPYTGSLANRFDDFEHPFKRLSENIAMGHPDAIYAHESLMNSYGHRINILNPDFDCVGIGVYQKKYTQNFMKIK